jgi:hypothetical protein
LPKPAPKKKTPAELLAEKKSANWLVDGVMKKDEKDPKDELDPSDKTLSELATDSASASSEMPDTKKESTSKSEPAKNSPKLNPLTRYMASWMTPQDYTLLKSSSPAATPASLLTRVDGAPSANAASDFASSADPSGALDLMAISKTAAVANAAPSANPYLQSFMPPPQNIPNFSAPAAAFTPPPSMDQNVSTPAPGPASGKSRMPDFAKPAADEKYFKQLKRF